MKIKKLKTQPILKYLVLLFVCFTFANAQINGLSPFLYAFLFALVFVGVDEKIASLFILTSAILFSPKLETLLVAITYVAVVLIVFYIHKALKRSINIATHFIAYFASNATYIYYNYTNFLSILFYVLLGLISLYVMIVVLQSLWLKKNCFKLTLDESICFLFCIALIGVGLTNVNIANFSVARFVAMMIVFIFLSVGSTTLTFAITISFCLGLALYDISLAVVAEFAILALLSGIFAVPNKGKIVFVTLISDIFIQYFFMHQDIAMFYEVLPIIFASILFLLLPKKVLNNLTDFVYVKKSEISSRNLINTTRKNIRKRMAELSNVFMDMKQLHLNMVKKELNKEELIAMLTREVTSTCCKDCLDKNRCTRSLGTDNKSNLETLINIAVTKGKVTLLDIPNGLSNRCAKVNNLISLINRVCDEYRQYKSMLQDINNVKILLADQMGAVSKLLLNIGTEIDTNVTFDIARENKIIARLLNMNIECKEVLLYTEKTDDISAVIVVKSQEEHYPLIEKVITETLKVPMQVVNSLPVADSNFRSITLRKKSKFDCMFGLASCNKSGNIECGDCHSIIRLGADKFLLALCDGMGAGKSAHKMSAMTLGLIENFYKVGFDNDTILESVNKLLAINNQENYSTLDVCLLDLNKEIADFIKVGSPFGVIKRESNIEIVDGGALPIGALDNISPAIKKTTVSTKDIIILATDGIMDAFETQENFVDFVSALASNNPQTLAETILNEALQLNEMSAKDDMTVLVARTYLKN
ncbi:MAG: SpoIIE family protein phosphatase [Clostridia bacterium]|nr:SpoIIE family protein phosphatase [Clostridia bacterium]